MTVDVDTLMPEIEASDTPSDLPEAQINADPPADKEPQERDEAGKFAGKDKKEPAKEPAKEVKQEPKQPQTIPLAAHLEERKALKAELDAMRKEIESLKNPPKPPAPEPDYAADPKAYTDYKLKAALEQLEGTNKRVESIQQTAQQVTAQTEQMQFLQSLQGAEAAFVKEAPDYYDALAHVRNIRAQQLKVLMPDMTDDQLAKQIGQEELGFAMQLARSGRNPMATVYQLAQSYGYRRRESAPDLPEVEKQRRLPPDQTLGTGASGNDEPTDKEDSDPFMEAFAEMYGRKRA